MSIQQTEVALQIVKIVTHTNPHIDEICGIWMLRKFGSKHFPNIEKSTIEYWSKGSTLLQKTAEELLAEGILLVGIGGGMFDEHPTIDSERKKDKCAATLIAEHLGLDDDPALEMILSFVERDDLSGSGSIFELGSLCRKMYNILPTEKVILWATMALEAIYREQAQFAHQALIEYSKARISTVRNGENSAKIVTIESDDETVAKFARSARGGAAALVIQKQSTGNVQIFSNRKFRPNMEKIARFIRLSEQKTKGKILTLKPEDLERDGSVRGAEEWHFFKKGQMLLNGSSSHPDVPPTKIALTEITRIACACIF